MTEPDEPIPDTLPMLTPHDAARAVLTGVACELGLDEVRVLVRIGERLQGRKAASTAATASRPQRHAVVPQQGGPRGARGRPRLPRLRLAQGRNPTTRR